MSITTLDEWQTYLVFHELGVNNDGVPKAEQVLTLLSIGDINYGVYFVARKFVYLTTHTHGQQFPSVTCSICTCICTCSQVIYLLATC